MHHTQINRSWFLIFLGDIRFDYLRKGFIAGLISLNNITRPLVNGDQVIVFVEYKQVVFI
jgi:hypothetical protein